MNPAAAQPSIQPILDQMIANGYRGDFREGPGVTDATREHERAEFENFAMTRDAVHAFHDAITSQLEWHLNNGAEESWEAIY